jgi:hypothetical protein
MTGLGLAEPVFYLLGGYIIVPAPGLEALTAGQEFFDSLIPQSSFFTMRDKNQLLFLVGLIISSQRKSW